MSGAGAGRARGHGARTALVLAAAGLVTGCNAGGSSGADSSEATAPTVLVQAGTQEVTVQPSQYCVDGEGERYSGSPPIIEVSPDSPITLSVDPQVAEQGWSVQVYDDQLARLIGEVDVEDGTETFDGINSSDAAPAAYYLVVVEDSDDDACSGLSGAWPVGFLRS